MAAGLVPLLRMDAPVIRHAFWRGVVVACLLLPLVQPWRSTDVDASMSAHRGTSKPYRRRTGGRGIRRAPVDSLARDVEALGRELGVFAGAILACGVALRLVWLVLGIHRLQRLRRAGELA